MDLTDYTRVSGKGQVKDGYGLVIQHADCQALAKAAGHKIVKRCTDDGLSGTLGADVVNGENMAARPGLQEAIAAVQDGEADGIIVGELDRLGRATHVQEAALAMVWRGGHAWPARAPGRQGARAPGRQGAAAGGRHGRRGLLDVRVARPRRVHFRRR